MLYIQSVLDLIEHGPLVLKSNFKVLPVSVGEVFLLQLNIRFQTTRAFEKVPSSCYMLSACPL